MRSIVLETPGRLVPREIDSPPSPGPGEVLLRVRSIGVCGTDLHAYRGEQPFFSYPRTLGHELGVEVVAHGDDVPGFTLGDRCSVEPYLTCGTCVACRRGRTNCCTQLKCLGVQTEGGMMEHIVLPAALLHRSSSLSFDQLALVEMLSVGAHAVRRADPSDGEQVLVVGVGPIGLATAAFAQRTGAEVAVADLSPHRLAFAHTHLGVETLQGGPDLADRLVERFGDLPTVVFDATGHAGSMEQSFELVAHSGTLVFVGLVQADLRFHDPLLHRKELTVMGSRCATALDFKQVIGALEQGELDVAPWITHRVGFEDAVEAFPTFLDPEAQVVKAVIEL